MLQLAYNKFKQESLRSFFTVLGVVLAGIILMILLYYLRSSWMITDENYIRSNIGHRLLTKLVYINGTKVNETSEGEIYEEYINTNDSLYDLLLDYKGTKSICVQYRLPSDAIITIDKWENIHDYTPIAVDTRFTPISEAVVEYVGTTLGKTELLVAGHWFTKDSRCEVMVSSLVPYMLGIPPKELVDKSIDISLNVNDEKINASLKIIGVYEAQLGTNSNFDLESRIPFMTSEAYFSDKDILFTRNFLNDIYKSLDKDKNAPLPEFVLVTMRDVDQIDDLIGLVESNYENSVVSDYKLYQEDIENHMAKRNIFMMLGLVVLIITVVVIANTIIINAHEHKSFVRIMYYLGFSGKQIRKLMAFEGMIYGGIGGGISGCIGYSICSLISMEMMNSYFFSDVTIARSFVLPVIWAILLVILIIILCALVGWIAAFSIRKSIVNSMNINIHTDEKRSMNYVQS